MGIERVRAHLAAHGLEERVRELAVSSATVELAASALGCPPQRIAKTLAFDLDGSPLLVVFAGDARIDNRRFKEAFAVKPRMMSSERVAELVGFAPGGVCPFGVPVDVPVFLDASLRRFDVVYPAGGTASSVVELTPAELEDASGARGWVEVSRLPDAAAATP